MGTDGRSEHHVFAEQQQVILYSFCLRCLQALLKILGGLSHVQWKRQIVTREKIITECASSQMLPSTVSSEGNLKTGSEASEPEG